jgi:NADH-quinone oxidoreductase subunit A
MTTTPLAAYVLIFLIFGAAFILVNMLVGKLVRPARPQAEKGTIYECGEPTIGSAWVQFDLRFYVVALLFVIFDVEVAFFFPWAVVFGKANQVATAEKPTTPEGWKAYAEEARTFRAIPAPAAENQEASADGGQALSDEAWQRDRQSARELAWLAFWEILVFFGVLLVGFAYLWRRGDLAWVRSLSERRAAAQRPSPLAAEQELVGAGR